MKFYTYLLTTILLLGCSSGGDNDTYFDEEPCAPSNVKIVLDGSTQTTVTVKITWDQLCSISSYSAWRVWRTYSSSIPYGSIATVDCQYYYDTFDISKGSCYYMIEFCKGPRYSDGILFDLSDYMTDTDNNDENNSGDTSNDDSNSNDDNNDSDSGSAPSTPTGVTAEYSGSVLIPEITIRWNNVSGATSYKVYRSTSTYGTYSYLGYNTSTVFYDNSPKDGTNYYKVTAVNSYGESGYSSYSYCEYDSTLPPSAVEWGNCYVSGSNIKLNWSIPDNTQCDKPTSQTLKIYNPYTEEWQETSLSATQTSATIYSYLNYEDDYNIVKWGILSENSAGSVSSINFYNCSTKEFFY